MLEGLWTSTNTLTTQWMTEPFIQAPDVTATQFDAPWPNTTTPTTPTVKLIRKPTATTLSIVVAPTHDSKHSTTPTPFILPDIRDTDENSDTIHVASVLVHNLAQMMKVLLGFIIFVTGLAALVCSSVCLGLAVGKIKERGYDFSFHIHLPVFGGTLPANEIAVDTRDNAGCLGGLDVVSHGRISWGEFRAVLSFLLDSADEAWWTGRDKNSTI